MKVAQELKEAHIPRQVDFADTPKHPQIGLQQRKEALRPMLMHVPLRVFLLRVIHCVMLIARDQPVAAGRVRVELAAGLYGEVSGLLHRLDRKVPCRVDHDATLTAYPGDNGRPIFVVMAPPGLAFLATPPWLAAQRFLPTLLGLPLLASGVIEIIRFHGALQLPLHLVGQGGIAQPPAPAVARADMDPQLFGNTPRCTRQAQEKRGQNPVHHRALAAIQERAREVMEGALAGLLFTAVALQSRLVVIGPPGTNMVALTAGALQGTIFPPQRMDVCLALVDVEELVKV